MQQHGMMTAKELAQRLEVSERTIHRDMVGLSISGIPVVSERGSSGGWRLMDGYRTDLTGLSEDELQALLLAAAVRIPSEPKLRMKLESALAKLFAATPSSHRLHTDQMRARLHIDGLSWHGNLDKTPLLPYIQEAVWNDCELEIRYRKPGEISVYTINPLGIVAKGNVWYLVAAVDSEYRTFRISRIEEAHLTGKTFDRPESFDLADYWTSSTLSFYERLPRYPAVLRFEEQLLPQLNRLRYMKELKILERLAAEDSARITAEVVFDSEKAACEVLFAFGTSVEALEPDELRAAMLKRILELLPLYGTGKDNTTAE
jgi:predicted DNA-binding transcriptional regulator YafY